MLRNKCLLIILSMVSCILSSCSKGPKSVLEKAELATFIIYTFDEHGSPAGCGSGFYYYNSKGAGQKLGLSGYYTNEGQIVLNEYDQNGTNTGKFDGHYNDGAYRGTFYAYGNSQSYNFYLSEM